ncbi:hypothetical protein A6R68_06024 [Neotoma lepida]|uniref:Uncharacterized protein n=1 Tax=Neotoma lepida TaxID=56216 RepID=A0A1A6GJC4_NEOLE|nr:hypothetical protein A6R68_06024 [Neotoma lepida]
MFTYTLSKVKLKIVVFKEKNWDRELDRPRAQEPMEKMQRCQAEGIFKTPCSWCPVNPVLKPR